MTAKTKGYKSETQQINYLWTLTRPRPDHYKGSMPLWAEEWTFELAEDILRGETAFSSEDVLGRPLDLKSKSDVMNVFCGMNKFGLRIDVNPEVKPDLNVDTHELSKHLDPLTNQKWVIFGDSPYSRKENLELYGRDEDINYKKWSSECIKFLRQGGLFIVYHKITQPNPDPERFAIAARVGVVNRTGHGVRIALFFRKLTEQELAQRAASPKRVEKAPAAKGAGPQVTPIK